MIGIQLVMLSFDDVRIPQRAIQQIKPPLNAVRFMIERAEYLRQHCLPMSFMQIPEPS